MLFVQSTNVAQAQPLLLCDGVCHRGLDHEDESVVYVVHGTVGQALFDILGTAGDVCVWRYAKRGTLQRCHLRERLCYST